ncbi:hypothetical protein [Campylobacter geochelonis]|uniref:Uncharacterized ACR, COG1399 n=1 Tax=Campylobacter geochelonis TaxID=1780362 RepID=A0A128EAB5_9BACT|nr:hypothetical protein [Campylobacter geochelonis]QKF70640.1 hypothetical protein CGEO_0307 [Campylobacter geochelonis]CZE45879.1 Uncharacterized ACR%2C COG1399 [Campylobacter geochelonis]
MKLNFSKINFNEFPFEIQKANLTFAGNLKRQNAKTVKCDGQIYGKVEYNCDRCGDNILLDLDEKVDLVLSDGIYKSSQDVLEDVVEFFDGEINFDEILQSEIEAYKSDYFYCDKCKNL